MKKYTNPNLLEWIHNETGQPGTVSRVRDFIPHRFSHSCKIIHPIYRDPYIEDETLLWSECNPDEVQNITVGERLRMKELAGRYGLPVTKGFSSASLAAELGGIPRFVLLGDEGDIGPPGTKRLIEILQPFSNGMPCYFYFELLKTEDYRERIYAGKLAEMTKLNEMRGSPTYCWPEDKSWCLYTDLDLDFSIMGGGRELIEALLADDFLECITVDRSTRITPYSDKT